MLDEISIHAHDSDDDEHHGSRTRRHGDEDKQGTRAQNHDAQEANSGVSPQNPTTGPKNDLDGGISTNNGRGEVVDGVNCQIEFRAETNDQNVQVLAHAFDVISIYQELREYELGSSLVCDDIDELIKNFRSLMFKGTDGTCRICTRSCLQVRDLSPHLCGEHLGQFIQQKSKSRKMSALASHVEQLRDVDRRIEQERFLALAQFRGQGADDEQSDADQSTTPKRRNHRTCRFIDDQAGVGREGYEDHNDSPVFDGVEANVHDVMDDQAGERKRALSMDLTIDTSISSGSVDIPATFFPDVAPVVDARVLMDFVATVEYEKMCDETNPCAAGAELCTVPDVALLSDSLCFVCNLRVHDECSITITDFGSTYPHVLTVEDNYLDALDDATLMRRICRKCEVSQAHGERD